MPTKKASTKENAPAVLHRIHALLHTLRCVAQHEDQLCTLWHSAKAKKTLSASLQAELRELLNTMPAEDFIADLEALRDALPAPKK